MVTTLNKQQFILIENDGCIILNSTGNIAWFQDNTKSNTADLSISYDIQIVTMTSI